MTEMSPELVIRRVADGRVVYSRFFTGDQYMVGAFWRE
jgi:hypothetical protein